MAHPSNFRELKAALYRFDNDARCRGCGEDIEWWETPLGKKIPFNPMPPPSTAPAIPHWKTCKRPVERK